MKEFISIFNSAFWFGLSVTVIAVAGIWGIVNYTTTSNELMAQNIETAISKGLDPLSVRCSYAHSMDNICVAYAASRK
jgi:hypothetical protein